MKALAEQDEGGGLRIAPLIDCVFLLLTFFLVATTLYEEEKDITIRLADASQGKVRDEPARICVVNVKESGVLVVHQRVVTLEQLERELREARGRSASLVVVVRCDRNAYHKHFVRVLDLCEKVGVAGVAVATTRTDA
jgi:biopolymer transport protein ExbD